MMKTLAYDNERREKMGTVVRDEVRKGEEVARRILPIGLGGSGQKVIAKVLERVGEMVSVVYRVYDTQVLAEYAHRLEKYLIPADMVRAELILKHPEDYPKIEEVLRLEKIPPITNTEGTGQFLSQGTLLFVATLPKFIENIKKAVEPLLSGTLATDVRSSGRKLADSRLYCIVVRSCAGGTGSGPHALIMWLLRHLLVSLLGHSSRLVLIDLVIMPEAFESHVEDKMKIYANAGAFLHMLSEYNRHDRPPVVFEFGDDPELHIQVGGGLSSDITFLVSNRNLSCDSGRGATILSLGEIYDMVANFIALHSTSPMISQFYAQYGNIQQEAYTMLKHQPTIFSSLGYTEAIFRGKVCRDWLILNETRAIFKEIKGGKEDVREDEVRVSGSA